MKKLFCGMLALVCMLSLVLGVVAESRLDKILASGKITMATSPDFAPSEFIDLTKSGQDAYVGADIELAKYIAEKLGVELMIEAMDFSAVQGAVTTGKVDMAISGFAYTEQRAESMELSDLYNVERTGIYQQGLLIRKEDAETYKTLADLSGKKIAAQNASLQYDLTSKYIPDATIEPITNLNDAVMMLITGKVDAVASSRESGEAFSANYDTLTMAEAHFEHYDDGTVVAVTKGETELMAKINEIIAEVNELGLYEVWKEEATALAIALGEM